MLIQCISSSQILLSLYKMQDGALKTLRMLKITKVICQGQKICFLNERNVFVILSVLDKG